MKKNPLKKLSKQLIKISKKYDRTKEKRRVNGDSETISHLQKKRKRIYDGR